MVNKWDTPPWLIDENLPGQYADAFDGFYAWINPGAKGMGRGWQQLGRAILDDFYQTMAVEISGQDYRRRGMGGFDDSKASWGLNRHISARCGQTFHDTFNFWKKYYPSG